MTSTDAPRLDRLMAMMGARPGVAAPGEVEYTQPVGDRLHDHRGRTILGSVGVLVDSVPGEAAGRARPAGTQMVLSQITATLAAPFPDSGDLLAQGRVVDLDIDAGIGLSAGELTGPDGRTLAVLTARSVIVSRGATHIDAIYGGDALPIPATEPRSDPAELAGRSGVEIVAAIAAGSVARGPLAGLFGVELTSVDKGRIVGEFTPQPWMANYLGSVQGGNLVSVADLLAGLCGQSLAAADQPYRALDLRLDFVRSPALDGGPVRVRSEVIRAGRRLALVETELTDSSGVLVSRAQSSIQLL